MKKIILLGAGIEQISVIQLAKKIGYRTYVLDQNPNSPGVNFAHKYFKCDISSIEDVFKISKKINIEAIKENGQSIKFQGILRIDTEVEIEYIRYGGILQYVLANLLKQ